MTDRTSTSEVVVSPLAVCRYPVAPAVCCRYRERSKSSKVRTHLSRPEREVVPRLKTENSVETSGNRPWCEVSQSSLVVWGDSKTYDRRR